MITTIIIDAERIESEKISALLSGRDDIKVAACGKDGYAAMKLSENLKPDIAILDYRLDSISDENILSIVRIRSPLTKVVIMTEKITDREIYRTLVNKVSGIVHKKTDMEIFPRILEYIYEGGCFISPCFTVRVLNVFFGSEHGRKMADRLSAETVPDSAAEKSLDKSVYSGKDPAKFLSNRELRLLASVGEGRGGREIAESMNLTAGTVRNYISAVMRKIGLRNRSQMIRYAIFHGLVPLDTGPAAPKTARR